MKKERNDFFCINMTEDAFGNEIDTTIHGSVNNYHYRQLGLVYKPCIPRQLTNENKGKEKCLIDDINDEK